MNRSPRLGAPGAGVSLRQLAAAFAIFLSMQPFDNGALGEVTRLAVFASAGLAVVVVGARPLRTLEMMKAMHLRAVFIVPLASMVWSVNRASTETALLSFVGASAIAILIIQELTNERAIAAVIVATGAALLLSIAAELFFVTLRAGASFGVSGIFEHKNALGRAAILLSMAALVAWSMRGRSRLWTTAALLGLAALLSIWTGSGTSTVTVGITIASFLAMSIGRIGPFRDVRIRHMSVIFVLFAMLTSAIIVGPTNLIESVLAVLGRESDNNTLFVRLSLWKATLNEIVDKPLLGFGYGTFNFETVTVSTGSRTVVWEAQQPHNGALHVAYQLGLLGVLVYARHLVTLWRSASVSIRRSILGPYLLIVGLANITYSMFYGTLAVFWIVHIIVAWAVVERTRIHHDNGVPS